MLMKRREMHGQSQKADPNAEEIGLIDDDKKETIKETENV
jgi:hypothetical protein